MPIRYEEVLHPLRVARLKRGMSQATLSTLSGIDEATISKIENCVIKRLYVDQLQRLGAALDCAWWRLVPETTLNRGDSQ